MKITQRLFLLLIMNIISLVGMAGVIFSLGETEQEYYKLSNQVLEFKHVLSREILTERFFIKSGSLPGNREMILFELNKEFRDIDQTLMKGNETQLKAVENFLQQRKRSIKIIEKKHRSGAGLSTPVEYEYIKLDSINDQLILITDNLLGEIQYKINIREDREFYAIISGLLLITLLSIVANAAFGQSIVKPIEQLRSYVLSIDLTNLKPNMVNSLSSKIDSRKHLELSQLADSYEALEKTLFEKMNELKERSESLSDELKEKKITEKKLKNTERYLNNIIQSLKSVIITTDIGFNLTHSNELAEEYAVNSSRELFSRFPGLKVFEKKIRIVMNTGQPYLENSVEFESEKDRYFNLSITPLAGDITDGIVIRLDDITNLKSIERQLIQTQKWETLGVLTSGFAHDFNNVLTGIVTSSSILMHKSEKDYPNLDKSYINCLKIIDKSGKRAAAMIQQLLSLSRNNELTFTNVDLNQSISDIQSICINSFDKSVGIEVELLENSIPILADGVQIEQTILNLCINAYHAMTEMRGKDEEPGGTLRISMKQMYMDRFNRPENQDCIPGEYIALSISDTGVGIETEKRDRIFDPFYTTKDKTKGTGLGLTMVQHIINQHNGTIELYSELGRGTVFTIYLPVSLNPESKSDSKKEDRELVLGSGTVLIIDDEEILRILTESILKECGYNVIKAEDGYKGVDAYRENMSFINLVILDMSMPGISGKETFIQLKQINPELKVLMSSGFTKDDRIQDLINMGLEDFIQKPYDYIELSEKVSHIINS